MAQTAAKLFKDDIKSVITAHKMHPHCHEVVFEAMSEYPPSVTEVIAGRPDFSERS